MAFWGNSSPLCFADLLLPPRHRWGLGHVSKSSAAKVRRLEFHKLGSTLILLEQVHWFCPESCHAQSVWLAWTEVLKNDWIQHQKFKEASALGNRCNLMNFNSASLWSSAFEFQSSFTYQFEMNLGVFGGRLFEVHSTSIEASILGVQSLDSQKRGNLLSACLWSHPSLLVVKKRSTPQGAIVFPMPTFLFLTHVEAKMFIQSKTASKSSNWIRYL